MTSHAAPSYRQPGLLGLDQDNVTRTCRCRGYAARTAWSALSPSELAELWAHGKVRLMRGGEVLYHQGDPATEAYSLRDGLLAQRKVDESGTSVLIRLIKPGELFGYRELVLDSTRQHAVDALVRSELYRIPAHIILRLLRQNRDVSWALLRSASLDAATAEEKYCQQVSLTAKARFARLIMELAEDERMAATGDSVSFELPLQRQDLGALMGAVPETLSRMVRLFEDQGLAVFSGRHVTVPSLMRLDRIASGLR
jgi:CRP-like cAMP-binding protein